MLYVLGTPKMNLSCHDLILADEGQLGPEPQEFILGVASAYSQHEP